MLMENKKYKTFGQLIGHLDLIKRRTKYSTDF